MPWNVKWHQAGTTCGASSQPDLIQNHFLIARMVRFLRHSRQKVPYFNILWQKVTYFNVLWQKVRNFNVLQQREGNTEMTFFLSLSFITFSPFPLNFLILSPFPHSLSISAFSVHFLILCPFPHSLSISSFSVHFLIHCLSLIHIWRCRRSYACRSRWSPYH